MAKWIVEAECMADIWEGKCTIMPIPGCKDCKHYDEMEDTDMPGYRECHYFSNWATSYYMLPNDYCSCVKRKDEVEE